MSPSNSNYEDTSRFAKINKSFGLAATEATHQEIDHPEGKTVVYSTDPHESDVPPKFVTFNSLKELREAIGRPADPEMGRAVHSLEVAPILHLKATPEGGWTRANVDKIKISLSEEQKQSLKLLSHKYIAGVKDDLDGFDPLLDALHFPLKVAIFSSPKPKVVHGVAVIKSKHPGEPVIWNYPEVIMGRKAEIKMETDFILEAHALKSAAGPNGDLVINNFPDDYPEPAPAGSNPSQPPKAAPGDEGVVRNSTAKGCPLYCAVGPTNGHDGKTGTDGGDGEPGRKGLPMSSLIVEVDETVGTIILNAGGGNGQNGGHGGNGSEGGLGGDPGSGPTPCGTANPGPQGTGGKGGKGGNGGDGGDVGLITFKLPYGMPEPKLDLTIVKGAPGSNGVPGEGGNPGGAPGDPNDHTGKPSLPPKIVFEYLPPQQ